VPASRLPRVALLVSMVILLSAGAAAAIKEVGFDLGYTASSDSSYGSGLIYGGSLIEAGGRFGLMLSLLGSSNSISYRHVIKSGGSDSVFNYEEKFSDFRLGILGAWIKESADKRTRLVAALGPEVHFLRATKFYIVQRFSETAREQRLGAGFMVRLERRLDMFGKTTLLVGGSFSWMEAGVRRTDVYTPPPQGLTSGAVTFGLAFPF
jgi:hypothetical protein